MTPTSPSTGVGARVLLGAAILIVATAVAAGVLVLRTPAEERALRLDERRVQDLQGIERAIERRWLAQPHLPATLDELARQTAPPLAAADPVTGSAYEYRAVSRTQYELCASFAAASPGLAEGQPRDFWSHAAGRECFRVEARALQP